MKEHTRNVAVGLTVLVALVMFGGMVMMFAGLPELLQTGRVLRMKFPDTAGAKSGEWVYMSGIQVGKITSIDFVEGDSRKGVMFVCRINSGVKLPGNVEPTITSRALMGGPYLSFQPTGDDRHDPVTGEKLEYLPEDWPEPLNGRRVFTSMLPKELTDGLKNLSNLAESLNSLVAAPAGTQPAGTQPTTQPAPPAPPTLLGMLAKFDRALTDVHDVLGDEDNQKNFKKTMAGLADASAKAADAMDALREFAVEGREKAGKTLTAASQAVDKIGTLAVNTDRRLEDISKEIVNDAEKLSKVLETVNRIATKMDTGEGTVAKLVNDPKLYDNFLQASRQLSLLSAELRVLVREWEKNGVKLKLK